MEDRKIELLVKIEEEDYVRINYNFCMRKVKKSFKQLEGMAIFFIFGCLILTAAFIAFSLGTIATQVAHSVNHTREFPFRFVIFLAIVTIFIIIIQRNIKKASRKTYQNNKIIHIEQKYIFSGEGIQISSECTNAKLPWDRVERVEINKYAYEVFYTINQAYLIPKRIFKDSNEENCFKEMLNFNLPGER